MSKKLNKKHQVVKIFFHDCSYSGLGFVTKKIKGHNIKLKVKKLNRVE